MTSNLPAHAQHFPLPLDLGGGAIRVLDREGHPWFVAADICAVLDIKNVSAAVARLGEDEKGIISTDTLGGSQGMLAVSESGLYALIIQSRKPSARAFQDWITREVLPSIREHGGYILGQEHLDGPEREALQAEIRDLSASLAVALPKAAAHDVIDISQGSITVTDAAKALKAKRVLLYAWMTKNGWVTQRQPRQATRYAQMRGYMEAKTSVDREGHVRITPRVTPKGLTYLMRVKAEAIAERKAAKNKAA